MCFISRKIPENIPKTANFKLLYFQKYLTNFQKINCSEFLKTYILILIRSESQQSSFKKHPDHPIFDVLLKTRPNATTVALEALIMCANNKPSKWLENLSESERAERFEEAWANVIPIKERMRARRKQILDERKTKKRAN